MKLIHYGSNEFIQNKFKNIKQCPSGAWCKPKHGTGLWCSPIESERGWKYFCQNEEFRLDSLKKKVIISLNPNAKILKIDSLQDLIDIYKMKLLDKKKTKKFHYLKRNFYKNVGYQVDSSWGSRRLFLNYELLSQHYDAIHLTAKGQWKTRMPYYKNHPITGIEANENEFITFNLYGWDCESVLILRQEAIKRKQKPFVDYLPFTGKKQK